MPVTKSAIKKLKQDKKRQKQNDEIRKRFSNSIKKAKKQKSEKNVKDAISQVDKAVKNNIIHKNKAARIKASLSKLVKLTPSKTSKTTKKKTTVKKSSTKSAASKK